MPLGGAGLLGLASIDASELDPRLLEAELVIATDVTNVLCGPTGASATFGPQKGASPDDVALAGPCAWNAWPTLYDASLALTCQVLRAAARLEAWAPASLHSLARTSPGAPTSSPRPWGSTRVWSGASLVITGEGRLDWQTAYHKAPAVVANRASERGIPVLGVGGSLGPGWRKLYAEGFTVLSGMATGAVSVEEAMSRPSEHLFAATVRGLRALRRRGPLV